MGAPHRNCILAGIVCAAAHLVGNGGNKETSLQLTPHILD